MPIFLPFDGMPANLYIYFDFVWRKFCQTKYAGYDVYTILTKISRDGAKLDQEPEFFAPHRDRRSKATIHKELDDDVTYTPGDLDRDVVAEDQIRLIIKTFKDRLFTDIFPGRTEVPKTKSAKASTPTPPATLGAKISRLAGSRSEASHNDFEKQTSGQPVSQLISTLFDSVDADKNRELAASKFSVTPDAVTDAQLDEIEAEQVRAALTPFNNPQLREILLRPEHQVIDKFTRDQLLTSSFDPEAKLRAETLVTSFRQFIEDHKDEIEAISILYSRSYSSAA